MKYGKSSLGKKLRHDPLDVQLFNDAHVTEEAQAKGRGAQRRARTAFEKAQKTVPEKYIPQGLSRKILAQAREQQDEVDLEEHDVVGSDSREQRSSLKLNLQHKTSDDEEDDEAIDDVPEDYTGHLDEDVLQLDEEDEQALQLFMAKEPRQRKTLADSIMEKIKDKETEIKSMMSDAETERPIVELNPKVMNVYQTIGRFLERYRSGKLPKLFKVIPSLKNWDEILYVTAPDLWSPQAVFQATRIFASNLNVNMAQRFYNLVLLPRVRDEFRASKTLNFHLYMALKKALYKPPAFFKGILLPLCEAGDCSLREAAIIGSVLSKLSVPMLHSAAALLRIAEMDYTGTNSLFMRVLIDKKYALPYQVVDAVVFHFVRFELDTRQMPVLWHQAFLVFVQRYKEEMTIEQKEALLQVTKKQSHPSITPEVRRELINSRCRGDDLAVLGENEIRSRAARLAELAAD